MARGAQADLPDAGMLETDLMLADSAEAVEDWSAQFRLLQQRSQAKRLGLDDLGLDDDAAPTQRRPSKGSLYQTCCTFRLNALASRLALPAEDLAQNVETMTLRGSDAYQVVRVEDAQQMSTLEAASDFVTPGSPFTTPETCLKARSCLSCSGPTVGYSACRQMVN